MKGNKTIGHTLVRKLEQHHMALGERWLRWQQKFWLKFLVLSSCIVIIAHALFDVILLQSKKNRAKKIKKISYYLLIIISNSNRLQWLGQSRLPDY